MRAGRLTHQSVGVENMAYRKPSKPSALFMPSQSTEVTNSARVK